MSGASLEKTRKGEQLMSTPQMLIAIDASLRDEIATLRSQNEKILELLSGSGVPGEQPKVRLLRVNEVTSRLGIGKTMFFEGVKSGKFPAGFRHGGLRLWREDEIDEAIERLSCGAEN